MTNEIRLAFAHPEDRAASLADGVPRDRISLRDYELSVEIGAFQAERGTTQRVRFNVVVEVQTAAGALADDVDKVLSYDTITDAIDHELAAERVNLLETLAERVAERVLLDPRAAKIFVRIEKLDRGPFALGVEIVRRRSAHLAPVGQADDSPRPRLAFLSDEAIQSENLPKLLDALEQGDSPVILCVGPAPTPSPEAAHPAAQRRIDLLGIEQNAWVLAGRDKRCVVVDARTELDWAMRHGQMTVWAPSKIVLDAADGATPAPKDPVALMIWLGERLHATDMVMLGGDAPVSHPDLRHQTI